MNPEPFLQLDRTIHEKGRLTARDLGLPVDLYDPRAYYNAVRDRWVGTGDFSDTGTAPQGGTDRLERYSRASRLFAVMGIHQAEGERFRRDGQLLVTDVDVERLLVERARQTSFADAIHPFRLEHRRVALLPIPAPHPQRLLRPVDPLPFVLNAEQVDHIGVPQRFFQVPSDAYPRMK